MPFQFVIALASLAVALGCVLLGVASLGKARRTRRASNVLERALGGAQVAEKSTPKRSTFKIDTKWLDTRIGKMIVAEEDRRLLDRAGFTDISVRARFLAARIAGAVLLPSLVLIAAHNNTHGNTHGTRFIFLMFGALVAGFMGPKWIVRHKATARQRSVSSELPMFVDLLRILQGVGLSLDQSLHVIVGEFTTVLPVLVQELYIAQAQYATGRTREQAMKRLATTYDNDDLAAVLRLMVQIEQHGGAVQEPLKTFGDRLREVRRVSLRERIGKLTVKMTGVMVLTLLPALLIMTAGPGFLAIIHSLAGLNK
ncbi:type II secretion system F family protein [Caballeronia sp. BR00000012568055]|uniref:type II secretion system F family protein n=1 Tax=Caballeronia sp. BR00000012568055 TaxID=2918761 RepID=UPI0023FA1203|nr:type II secretion system F family protein [Caballeronia sp. BR00000012568055]